MVATDDPNADYNLRCDGCKAVEYMPLALAAGWVYKEKFDIGYCPACVTFIREWLTGLPDTEGDARGRS